MIIPQPFHSENTTCFCQNVYGYLGPTLLLNFLSGIGFQLLLADDSHGISYFISFEKRIDVAKFVVCCAVIGALRVNGKQRTTGRAKQVAQWATIAHHGACIMFGDTIIYDAQRQITLNLKQ